MAVQGDDVYRKVSEVGCGWPKEVSEKGKLRDARYGGHGWPLHFRNPDRTMAPVSNLDLKRVCEFLNMEWGLLFWQLSESSPWMWQLNSGLGPTQVNLQFFPTKLGRVSFKHWNAGAVETCSGFASQVKDACGSASLSIDQVASAVYQPGGAVLLPHIPTNAKVKDVETIPKSGHSRLRSAGKTAMTTYL